MATPVYLEVRRRRSCGRTPEAAAGRDKMVAHVVEAEKACVRKVGVKDGRDAFLEALRAARDPQPELSTKRWPWRYAARRVAWHVLDHPWEMEDRSG